MNDKIKAVVKQLEELRQDFCDIENKSAGCKHIILPIDQIDALLKKLQCPECKRRYGGELSICDQGHLFCKECDVDPCDIPF